MLLQMALFHSFLIFEELMALFKNLRISSPRRGCTKWKVFIGRRKGGSEKVLVNEKKGLFQSRSSTRTGTAGVFLRKFQLDCFKVTSLGGVENGLVCCDGG